MPIVSISGTNGKSTVTRLITHILVLAGRHVGTTTSDGILVDERLVEEGDWTGPGGAAQILERHDVDVAVLETARGGIMLRGVGYESNDASVLTNVSSDHLDLQGIHTLPELAEVKAHDRPDDQARRLGDPQRRRPARGRRRRAACARTSRSSRSTAERLGGRAPAPGPRRSGVPRCGGARSSRSTATDGARSTRSPGSATSRSRSAAWPATTSPTRSPRPAPRGRSARRSSRSGAASRDFRPSIDRSPGRLNIFRLGARLVIVDFAHNEAGIAALLDVAEGIAGGAAGRAAPITAIIGTAGDRPDDTLRGIGRIAAQRAQRVVVKETGKYLRGRTRESVVGRAAGRREGRRRRDRATCRSTRPRRRRCAPSSTGPAARSPPARARDPMRRGSSCSCARRTATGSSASSTELGARPVDVASELTALVPRLQDREGELNASRAPAAVSRAAGRAGRLREWPAAIHAIVRASCDARHGPLGRHAQPIRCSGVGAATAARSVPTGAPEGRDAVRRDRTWADRASYPVVQGGHDDRQVSRRGRLAGTCGPPPRDPYPSGASSSPGSANAEPPRADVPEAAIASR